MLRKDAHFTNYENCLILINSNVLIQFELWQKYRELRKCLGLCLLKPQQLTQL